MSEKISENGSRRIVRVSRVHTEAMSVTTFRRTASMGFGAMVVALMLLLLSQLLLAGCVR